MIRRILIPPWQGGLDFIAGWISPTKLGNRKQMKKSTVFLYWGLLLVPALIIGVVGFRLLSNERERWERMERTTAQERARAIAQTMRNTVDSVEREITDGLLAIPRESVLDTLLMWERENPLIRNAFVWQPKRGLRRPSSGDHASSEQMRFLNRYQTLFLGRTAWLPDDPKALSDLPGSASDVQSPSEAPDKQAQSYKKTLTQRAQSLAPAQQQAQSLQGRSQTTYGWIPWFTDNRLYLLGWVQEGQTDLVYGAELETVILISRLIEQFPKEENEGIVFGLIDDSGRLLHQLGRADVQPNLAPTLEVSLAPNLPHWRVVVYFDPRAAGARSGNAFLMVTGLLLATLIVAILLGGALLTRQAYAQWQDAQQKSSFVSNVSHELKTPLTTIRMYAELLAQGLVTEPEKKNRYLRVIVSEAERLTRLVNNVLGFSRLERGSMKYHIEDIDIVEFMRSFLDTNTMLVHEAGMSLKSTIPDHPVSVRADRDALDQTFLNIVDNAVKYACDGGALEIVVEAKGAMCEIGFLDEGPGIPAAYRSRIFDKFQQVDDSLTAARVGTGLGLTIARHMIENLGGQVSYEPRDGSGSCFIVRVPLSVTKSSESA
jgi:signal transduction histidine kinase